MAKDSSHSDRDNTFITVLVLITFAVSLVALAFSIRAMNKADDFIYDEHTGVESVVPAPDDPSDNLMRGTGQEPTQ